MTSTLLCGADSALGENLELYDRLPRINVPYLVRFRIAQMWGSDLRQGLIHARVIKRGISSNNKIPATQTSHNMDRTNGDQANGTNGANLRIGSSKGSRLLWRHASPQSTPMYQFMGSVNQKFGLQLSSYGEFHRWSIDYIDEFWGEVWKFVGVRAECEAAKVSCIEYLI